MEQLEAVTPDVAELARTATREAVAVQRVFRRARSVTLRPERAKDGTSLTIPKVAFDLLVQILGHLAHGNPVTLLPLHAEITTQQAADVLNVSRPFLVSLLETGKLPFHKVGTHRRIRMADLIAYKKVEDEKSQKRLEELTAEAEKLGLGY